MLYSKWILGSNRRLLCTIRYSEKCRNEAVILLPSLGESMCDIDYFMSRLAQHCQKKNYFILQLDIAGAGDSTECFDMVTKESVIEDVISTIRYLKQNDYEKITIVSRGIVSNFLQNSRLNIDKMISINPIRLINQIDYLNLEKKIHLSSKCEFDKAICGIPFFKEIIEACGIHYKNVKGQFVNEKLLIDIVKTINEEIRNNVESIFIFSFSKDNIKIYNSKDKYKIPSFNFSDYKNSFIRNPLWQQMIINKVVNLLE